MSGPGSLPQRPRALPIVAVIAVVGIAVVGIGVAVARLVSGASPGAGANGTSVAAVPPAAPGWTLLPASPLSAREGATAAWTGSVVVVVGGTDGPPCPPNARCPAGLGGALADALADGAAYDPASREWRPIAAAPIPIVAASTAVVGDTVFYWVDARVRPAFLAYDLAADAWRELPLPEAPALALIEIGASGDSVVGFRTSQEQAAGLDLSFDVATETWRELPPDPLRPSFDRSIISVGGRLVLTAIELVPNPGVRPPVYRAAILDVESGEWRRLPDSEVVLADPTWYRVGDLVVNPTAGSSDGGATNNWGRDFPHGGILDAARGAWLRLPIPQGQGPTSGLGGATDTFVVNRQGWVLDVDTLSWLPLEPLAGGPQTGAASTGAGDRLFVFGGSRFVGAGGGIRGELLDGAWEWAPLRE